MKIKKIKLNIIDSAVLAITLLFIATFLVSQVLKPKETVSKLNVTVRIYNDEGSNTIFDQANKDKTVYLNGVNKAVAVVEVKKASNSSSNEDYLDLVLKGPGVINEDGSYEFNGQRLLINQKAEIHGNYFVSGAILKIENAN